MTRDRGAGEGHETRWPELTALVDYLEQETAQIEARPPRPISHLLAEIDGRADRWLGRFLGKRATRA